MNNYVKNSVIVVWASFFNLLLGHTRYWGRYWAAIQLSHHPEQWFSTGVPQKTSVPWKIVRCSAGNL